MELELREQLLAFKDELTHFQSDDILVHVSTEKTLATDEIQHPDLAKTQRILKEAKRIFREIGIQPFCESYGLMITEKTTGKFIHTPIYLRNVPLKFNKSRIEFSNEMDTSYYINPYFERWYRINFSESPPPFEERHKLQNFFENEKIAYEPDAILYGNFHPQRYELLKEVEELLTSEVLSHPLKQLLGFQEASEEIEQWGIQPPYLFPSDPDQALVFQALNESSVTVQGPPGTGKSQVISNLIGSCIRQNKRVLIVSEKKAALTVLQQKLEQKNLGFLCSHLSFHASLHDFYRDLKNTWEFLSVQEINERQSPVLSGKEQQLTQIFHSIKSFEAETTISIEHFQERFGKQQLLQGKFPELHKWKEDLNILKKLAEKTLDCLPYLSSEWKNSKEIETLLEQFFQLEKLHVTLIEQFSIRTPQELHIATRQAILCHQFQGNIYEKYGRFLGKDKVSFIKTIKQWKKRSIELAEISSEQQHWLKEPSISELKVLKEAAEKKGIFARIQWKNTWKKWTRTPGLDAFEAISSKEKELLLRQSRTKLDQRFAELGLTQLDIELPLVEQLLQHNSLADWNWYQELPNEKRLLMAQSNRALNQLNQLLQHLFRIEKDAQLKEVISCVKETLPILQLELPLVAQLTDETFERFSTRASVEILNEGVMQQTWRQFLSKHPHMIDFDMRTFKKKLLHFLSERKQSANDFAQTLIHHQAKKFNDYQKLLSAPVYKLSIEEKTLRGILRKGKSILVKEFGKTRQHQSIRDLRKSEARWWLDVLKPIQLSNPSSLASIYPLEVDQFDLLIFDEAGQIPMSYALGALQRANRVVVAGDHQQMSPSSYFRKSEEFVIDVLHQSAYYFQHVLLTRHYRSRHPELIAFSNEHFYGGRLRTFAVNSKKVNPLIHTYVENGCYENRVNLQEAKIVAQKMEKALVSKEKYGIVAFSEAQLSAIYEQLSPKQQIALNDAIDDDRIFFKALEQVQGEECDHLLISFGYGKNTEGKFEMRFGPLNLINGAKRLNVLFSRAKSSIEFVCSVKSSDFSASKNEGVLRLKDWFDLMENQSASTNEGNSKQPDFESLLHEENEFHSFINRLDVLCERGWKLL